MEGFGVEDLGFRVWDLHLRGLRFGLDSGQTITTSPNLIAKWHFQDNYQQMNMGYTDYEKEFYTGTV